MPGGKIERRAIARRQQLSSPSPPPLHTGPTAWITCFAGKPIAAGDLCAAGFAAAERAAFGEQFRPRGTMDGAVDATAAEQRCGWPH